MHLIKRYTLTAIIASILAIANANGQRIINVGLHIGPSLSSINTSFPQNIEESKSEGGLNFNFRISGKYFLTEKTGVASGFEILQFKQTSSALSTYESFNKYYSESQYYERRVWGDSINEDVTLKVLHIPLHVFYQHKFNNAVAVFGSFGPGFSIPVLSKNSARGTFTYKGYFPEEKALLWDIPVYGLSSDVEVKTNNKLKTNPVIINVSASVGVELSLNRYYRFTAAAGYYRTIINALKTGNSVHISDETGTYNSLLNTAKNNLSNLWFSIGLSRNILF